MAVATILTLADLRAMMRACAGVDELVDLDGDIGDISFEELGYDSLALLEIQASIQRKLGVPLPDDALDHMGTPGTTLGWVNGLVHAAVFVHTAV